MPHAAQKYLDWTYCYAETFNMIFDQVVNYLLVSVYTHGRWQPLDDGCHLSLLSMPNEILLTGVDLARFEVRLLRKRRSKSYTSQS